MSDLLRRYRRGATQLAIRHLINVTAPLPVGAQRSAARSLAALAYRIPTARRTVGENMRLALGQDVPAQTVHLYFQHLGWFWSSALATFNRGFAATPVPTEVNFDQSISVLDEAAAEGNGVVLTAAHWSGHELAGATINLRHPMVMLVRPAMTSEREARKLKWYRALGAEIVVRPSGTSTIKDAAAYLNVLRRGKMLAITPDLLADPEQGVETFIFGRPARLYGGAFALAISARAPLIRLSFQWQHDSSLLLRFDRAPLPDAADRATAIRIAVQDWCRWFEDRLRANPENWSFWLDKRWSRFLRTTPRASGAA
ncbi:MAG TPA: lysophospholipid acyltransferase family protein [Xanthobacteraceae bacterium]|jgi:lauroyl/myristoyl acyltransferase